MKHWLIAACLLVLPWSVSANPKHVAALTQYMAGCDTAQDIGPPGTKATCGGATGHPLFNSNVATIVFEYTKGGGAGFECFIDFYDSAVGDFVHLSGIRNVNNFVTLDPFKVQHLSAAASTKLAFTVSHVYEALRVRDCAAVGGSPDANDKIKVAVRIGYTPSI